MKYTLKTTPRFDKEFKKLDRYTKMMIKSWILKNLVDSENPLAKYKRPTTNKNGQWRYRIGDYRLICIINDSELIIVALSAGHRCEVYN